MQFWLKIMNGSHEWCHMPAMLEFRRLRQKNCEFKASLDYVVRPCLRKKKK
jgi:predicted SprT family Zn-dependent metalloprotease